MKRIKVLCVLLLILLLLSACVNNTETTTTYSNPFDPPHFEPTEDYPEYEGEVNPLKNSRTFEEITDACIKVGEEIDSEPRYHSVDGNKDILDIYEFNPAYRVPECITNIIRYFHYSHVFYVNCFDYGDSKWAEQYMRIYMQAFMDDLGYKYLFCETDGLFVVYSSDKYHILYFSDECSCCFDLYVDDSEIAAPIYYGTCQELGWPYFDIETDTIVYPEDGEETEEVEDTEETEDFTIQDSSIEEVQQSSDGVMYMRGNRILLHGES